VIGRTRRWSRAPTISLDHPLPEHEVELAMSESNCNPASSPIVLVIDDDDTVRLIVRLTLENAGYAVHEEADGEAGLRTFARIEPALVLVDILMPGMDGFATCAALRQRPKGVHVPIVMMTGLDDFGSIHRAYEVGATDFITKPINPILLNYRVCYLLRAQQVAQDLRCKEARLANAQRIAKLGDWEWDHAAKCIRLSSGVQEIFGLPAPTQSLTPRAFFRLVHPDDVKRVIQALSDARHNGACPSLEYRVLRLDGTERVVLQETEVWSGQKAERRHISGTIQDITQRREAEKELNNLIYYDNLTGLPNRSLLLDRLRQAMANAEPFQGIVAVLCLDLDEFRRINDTLSYEVGDRLLKEMAVRLSACIRESDYLGRGDAGSCAAPTSHTIGRPGGDEFIVILPGLKQAENALTVLQRIKEALQSPFKLGRDEIHLTASVGISVFPTDGKDAEALLRNAESAMYHAKKIGPNNQQSYEKSLNQHWLKRLSLENKLRRALEREEELTVFYQPKIDIQRRKLVGMEALARWFHPELGTIGPAEFIPIAEQTGLIIPLGEYILRSACLQTRQWQEQGIVDLKVSVNLSAAQFRERDLVVRVRQILWETGLDPSHLELELTEGMLIENTGNSMNTLHALRDLGLDLSVDDFGTGYSSLSYLKRFPLNALKIDRCFVRDLGITEEDAAIVKATIALAHSLRLLVVAEGVEDLAQLRFLCGHGCDQTQGYLFSPPLDAESFVRWVEAWNPDLYEQTPAKSAFLFEGITQNTSAELNPFRTIKKSQLAS
jgi:PAS domain S-box-containing protein